MDLVLYHLILTFQLSNMSLKEKKRSCNYLDQFVEYKNSQTRYVGIEFEFPFEKFLVFRPVWRAKKYFGPVWALMNIF